MKIKTSELAGATLGNEGPIMSTRQYPRSILQVFGCDATSACAIERPRPNHIADYALAILIGLALALLLVVQLSK